MSEISSSIFLVLCLYLFFSLGLRTRLMILDSYMAGLSSVLELSSWFFRRHDCICSGSRSSKVFT